jgi:hypothetical protein
MDRTRIDLLSVLARDASLERSDYLVRAAEQFQKFLDANAATIRDIGGLTLIDDDPDYLAIAPDLSFRSRSRYLDDETGEWHSETEVIETGAELVELYSPAELFSAFTEAARAAAGKAADETPGEGDDPESEEAEAVAPTHDPYAGAADSWAASQDDSPVTGELDAARRLYDLALSYQERSQRSEADLVERFQVAAGRFTGELGELLVVESDEERLVLQATGTFRAEVEAENDEDAADNPSGDWLVLSTPEELVGFYDPTDVFGDLADALAEAFPGIAPEVTGDAALEAPAEAEGEGGEDDDEEDDEDDEAEADDADEDADRG